MRFGVETEAESVYPCIHVSITLNQLMRIYLLFEQLKHEYLMTATQSSRLGDSFKTCAKRQIFAKEECASLISKTLFVLLIRHCVRALIIVLFIHVYLVVYAEKLEVRSFRNELSRA